MFKEKYETPVVELEKYRQAEDILTASDGGLEDGDTQTNVP